MTRDQRDAPQTRPADNDRDPLTPTLTRQAFVARLSARAERAVQDAAAYGVCILDLDHFKNINLSHGPACGDDALRDVAQRLVRTNLPGLEDRIEPVAGRFDGDAFAVLIETPTVETLAAAAHALHRSVVDTASVPGMRLSASVGAVLARIGESAEAVLLRAEQCLYLAKQFGRDRVEIGRGPEPLRAGGEVLGLERSA